MSLKLEVRIQENQLQLFVPSDGALLARAEDNLLASVTEQNELELGHYVVI